MIFKVGVNTYMSVEEADNIVEDEFDSESVEYGIWSNSNNKQKERLIINGTRKINTNVWRGIQYPGFNSLPWPRLITYRFVDCPYDVKVAVIKQALMDCIYKSKQEASLVEMGVKTYQIKGASITFGENAANSNRLDNGIWYDVYREYLEKWSA